MEQDTRQEKLEKNLKYSVHSAMNQDGPPQCWICVEGFEDEEEAAMYGHSFFHFGTVIFQHPDFVEG